MALQIGTVAASIAAIEIEGLEIVDVIAIPTEAKDRNTPYIAPKPDGFLSDFFPERKTLGPGSTAAFDVTYTLTYRLHHSKIGSGRAGLFSTYSDMLTKASLFLDAIIENDTLTGAVNSFPNSINNFGPVADPMGNMFHGCDIGIQVLEYVN